MSRKLNILSLGKPVSIHDNSFLDELILTIDTKPDATVSEVLYQAQYKAGLSVNENRLIFGGKQLEPGRLLAEYDVQKGSTLHAVLRLAGGDGSPRDRTILSAFPDYIHNNDIYDGLRIENSLSRSWRIYSLDWG